MTLTRIVQTVFFCVLINTAIPAQGGGAAPGFAGTTLAGRDFAFHPAQLRTPVLAVFWASWCRECRYEFHELKKLHARFGERLHIYGISVDKDLRKARQMSRQAELPYISLFDPKAEIAARYRVRATPTLILIDASGTIRHTGHRLNAEFYEVLEQTLDAS